MPTLRKMFSCSLATVLGSPSMGVSLAAGLSDNSLIGMDRQQILDYLSPKPEDYIMVPMRALSAATDVQHNQFNFAHNDGAALKAAVGMFDGLTILKDHDYSVDNWIGKTQDSYWDTNTPNVPPGINFMLKVDTKADPKVARGLLSGMLDSGSVTIEFDYDKSHPKMDDFEFYMNLGQVVKGQLVQALVTSIKRCYEYSVVWQGADTNAKVIGPDGQITKPGLQQTEGNMKGLAVMLGLPDTSTETELTTALSVLQAAKITAETAKTTAETALTTSATELTSVKAELETSKGSVVTLTSEVTTLKTENDGLKASHKTVETHLSTRRAEALRLYNLSEGTDGIEAMRTVINAADLVATESFITTYTAKADKVFPLACTKCHSTDVSRRQSTQSDVSLENKAPEVKNPSRKQALDFMHS